MALNKLKVQRDESALKLSPKRTPNFAEYADRYIAYVEALKNKSKGTIHRERSCINSLKPHLGDLRLRAITKSAVKNYMAKRKEKNLSSRSINIEVVTLRNILRQAIDEGHLPISSHRCPTPFIDARHLIAGGDRGPNAAPGTTLTSISPPG